MTTTGPTPLSATAGRYRRDVADGQKSTDEAVGYLLRWCALHQVEMSPEHAAHLINPRPVAEIASAVRHDPAYDNVSYDGAVRLVQTVYRSEHFADLDEATAHRALDAAVQEPPRPRPTAAERRERALGAMARVREATRGAEIDVDALIEAHRGPRPGELVALTCPYCAGALTVVVEHDLTVIECDRCNATWDGLTGDAARGPQPSCVPEGGI